MKKIKKLRKSMKKIKNPGGKIPSPPPKNQMVAPLVRGRPFDFWGWAWVTDLATENFFPASRRDRFFFQMRQLGRIFFSSAQLGQNFFFL